MRNDGSVPDLAAFRARRVLIPGYYFTAAFWHREFLRGAGVPPEAVDWVSTAPELDPRMHTPAGVRITVQSAPERGIGLLLDGQVDAIMHEFTIAAPPGRERELRRLYPDVFEVEQAWYAETSVHPILHVMAVSREALERRPDLGVELCRAFDEAKAEAYLWLSSERTTSLPFMREAIDRSVAVLGDDPWAYGLERNARELNRFLDLAQTDGLTKTRARLEDLFDPRSLEYRFQARIP